MLQNVSTRTCRRQLMQNTEMDKCTFRCLESKCDLMLRMSCSFKRFVHSQSYRKISGTIACNRCHWPRDLRGSSAAARLLGLWVRITPGAWMSVCCERCVSSDASHCDELITRCVWSTKLKNEEPWPALGRHAKKKSIGGTVYIWLSPFEFWYTMKDNLGQI